GGTGTDLVAVGPGSGTSVLTDVNSAGSTQWSRQVSSYATSVAYQPDGNILTVGGFIGSGPTEQMFLGQFDAANGASGAPNTFFGSNGVMTSAVGRTSSVAALATQPDGKVVAAGIGSSVNSVPVVGLIRVFGPSLSVQPPPITDVLSYGGVGVTFTVSIDEPLFNDVHASLCAPGASINGGPSCTTVTIPTGTQAVPVNVGLNFPGPPGSQVLQTLAGQPAGGLAPSLTHPSAVAQISHLEYLMVASDGGIFNFHSWFWGSMGGHHLNAPIVGVAADPATSGYWMVASDGGIFAFNAPFYGSMGGQHLNRPIVGMATDPATGGYWMVASDGGIFSFNAPFLGSMGGRRLNQPIVGMAATPDGGGYWLVARDGGIFAFGDAPFYGSMGGHFLVAPIVGMATDASTGGYWMVASDGGIFSFNAPFLGSMGGHYLFQPIVGMAATPKGDGYWLVARDGGIFAFPSSPPNAPFFGSMGGHFLNAPIVGMAP
ncbi:MAG TPA: hypothetical protein VFH56_12105, partial [Acidimicrobiales bacterium]|nr:hypothetical protein [Acidimicrobiales bacterium]